MLAPDFNHRQDFCCSGLLSATFVIANQASPPEARTEAIAATRSGGFNLDNFVRRSDFFRFLFVT